MAALKFAPEAQADMAALDRPVAQRILKRLRWLADNFDSIKPEPLTGSWQGVFKFRIGDYRALYTFDSDSPTIIVHVVRHRREVYKLK